ncbi:hypothetical protein [Flagellimonas onchidii]|uniref:hypothetical protein n=1 Tax=Flagellimonas onchidii TaxID=2562684 RepID=UPI0010A615F0|nr:hypothetical protein [Allomuricauda onchidii]
MKAKLIALFILMLSGCSSAKLVSTWKNPDIVLFDAYKVLVVGMAQDENVRIEFETRVKNRLNQKGIDAMRSIDLFDVKFTSSKMSEQELSTVEQQLLDKGFDAILFTKVIGTENKRTFRERLRNIGDMYTNFSNDYLDHQNIYYDAEYDKTFKVYRAETSLYCICVDKERELIWRGNIDVPEPVDMNKTIDSYIKLIENKMQEQEVLF